MGQFDEALDVFDAGLVAATEGGDLLEEILILEARDETSRRAGVATGPDESSRLISLHRQLGIVSD
jgi:hypothetical protein